MNLTYAETRDGMRKPLPDSEVGVSEHYICQALNTTHWHERATGFYVTCGSGITFKLLLTSKLSDSCGR